MKNKFSEFKNQFESLHYRSCEVILYEIYKLVQTLYRMNKIVNSNIVYNITCKALYQTHFNVIML